MKLSQCITFTAIAATLLSTQTAAAKIGRPKADKASTQDQYETVLVQAKADKASYEKVIRSPTYAATPYPDSKFIDNPIWAKAGKGGRNLDRYGTAVILVESKAGKGGRNIDQYADRYVSQPEEAGANSFWPWNPTQLGEDCFFPTPTCASGLRCTAYVSSGRLRGDRWYDDTFQGQPGKCVYLGTNGKDTPGYPVAELTGRSSCIPSGFPDVVTVHGVHGRATEASCCSGVTYSSTGSVGVRCL